MTAILGVSLEYSFQSNQNSMLYASSGAISLSKQRVIYECSQMCSLHKTQVQATVD